MAHFAELDETNKVLRVVVTDNDFPNEGYDWLVETFPGRWVQTSYNGTIRKNFASPGDTYDEQLDAFIPPQPYPSWTLNPDTARWEAPTPIPDDKTRYTWNEDQQKWIG